MLSLTTLGTPNTGPPEDATGPWTTVDQTRGLLKNINERFPGAHVEGVRYTSVAGTAIKGEGVGWGRGGREGLIFWGEKAVWGEARDPCGRGGGDHAVLLSV